MTNLYFAYGKSILNLNFLRDDLAATPHDVANWISESAISSGVVTETWQILYFVDGKSILNLKGCHIEKRINRNMKKIIL